MTAPSAQQEWSRGWGLPLVGMLGVTGPAAFAYSNGVFMDRMTGEFGWSHTDFSAALTIQMLMGVVLGPLAGRVLDRVGSRRILLWGIPPMGLALSLLGLANGAVWQWCLLAALYAPLTLGAIPAAWIAGTISRFDKSRGLAISVVLAGIGVATAIWPIIAADLVQRIGWRLAFPAMGLGWVLVVYPLMLVLFKPAQVSTPAGSLAAPGKLGPLLRSRLFLCLICGATLFSSVQLALIANLVPILKQTGLDLGSAAHLAALTGLFSIAGRIGTGFLLDRLPTRPVAVIAFSLPLAVIALLNLVTPTHLQLALAASLLGLAAGSEMDVVTYLVARRFDPRLFGSVYAIIQAAVSIGASLGVMLAGRLFDSTGAYASYYQTAVPTVIAATLLILLIPPALKQTA